MIRPFERAGLMDRWYPSGFVLAAPVFVALAVVAVSVAVPIGAAVRRPVLAIAATLAANIAFANLATGALRFLLSLFPEVAAGSPMARDPEWWRSSTASTVRVRALPSRWPIRQARARRAAG